MRPNEISTVDMDARRIAALQSFGIMDTAPEVAFDDIAMLASQLCNTPVSLVGFIETDRQWYKAAFGAEIQQTPISQSICRHAIVQPDTLIIPDMTQDSRTRDNPLVTEGPQIRFYAGALLNTNEGVPIGTLCVIDMAARPEGLSAAQTASLEALARQVMAQLELRRLFTEQARTMADRLLLATTASEQQKMLSDEIVHRLKNILAMVQAIASQTLRDNADPVEAREALTKRIRALGDAHTILHHGATQSADIHKLIEGALRPHQRVESRFRISGPNIQVNAKAALMLVLMIHELATNATKYGALSNADGSVDMHWSITRGEADPVVDFIWRESGGPDVAAPGSAGFGTRLIERALAGTVGGKASIDYLPTGVVCHLTAPLSGFSGTDELAIAADNSDEEPAKKTA